MSNRLYAETLPLLKEESELAYMLFMVILSVKTSGMFYNLIGCPGALIRTFYNLFRCLVVIPVWAPVVN